MKFKPSLTRIINIILISICLLIDIGYFIYEYPLKYYHFKNYPDASETDDNLEPIDSLISTDLPYHQYKKLTDEQRVVRSLKNGDLANRSWSFLNVIGTGVYKICDTCSLGNIPETGQPYISLQGWRLKSSNFDVPTSDSVIFHVQNGQAYIRKEVITSQTNVNGYITQKGEYKDIPVKFMYSHKSQMLKIPVSEGLMNTMTIIMQIVTVLFFLLALIVVVMFGQLIMSLRGGSQTSRNTVLDGLLIPFLLPLFLVIALFKLLRSTVLNKPTNITLNPETLVFTEKNIFRLRVIAYSLIGFPMFLFLLNLLLRLIFAGYFTEDVVLNTERLQQWLITMHVGIIFLLILNAFIQGKALKDEQDLTV